MNKHLGSAFETFLSSNIHPDKLRPVSDVCGSSLESASTRVVRVHCPTCGSSAERYYLSADNVMRTQCAHCDYLMILCTKTGRVIESYAPSCSPAALSMPDSASMPVV